MSGEVSVNGLIIPSAPNTMSAGVWTQETTKLFLEGVWSSSVYIEGAIYIMCLWKLSEHDALVNHHFALKKTSFCCRGVPWCTHLQPGDHFCQPIWERAGQKSAADHCNSTPLGESHGKIPPGVLQNSHPRWVFVEIPSVPIFSGFPGNFRDQLKDFPSTSDWCRLLCEESLSSP